MDIISIARELGFAIQNDSDYIEFKMAEQKVECDAKLQEVMEAFKLKKIDINYEISKDVSDSEKIDKLNEEVSDLYKQINSNSNMIDYNKAKEKFDRKLQMVSLIINKSAAGEDPYAVDPMEIVKCSGSCQTCGGC